MTDSTTTTPRFRTLAIANQKGGVGKTTTAINLGTALAKAGEQVLVIDLDSQGNASTGFGIAPELRTKTSYEVLKRMASLAEVRQSTAISGLDVVPANSDLVGIDSDLSSEQDRAFRLRDALTALAAIQQAQPAAASYTYVLIDCPPALNLLTLNALVAAQAVLVPVQCEFFALEGISQLKENIDQIRGTLNPGLEIQGVVLTMYDARTSFSREVADNVRTFFGPKVYETVIPRNIKVAEAPSHGKPVLVYDAACSGSKAYTQLAAEMIERDRHFKAA